MIAHNPSLVILSTTIAILGAFTGAVMTSNLAALPHSERRMRLTMAAVTLGGSIWATHFVGLLALDVPVNLIENPAMLAASAVISFVGTAIALFPFAMDGTGNEARFPVTVGVLGITICATNYSGLAAVAGRDLRLSWFLAVICVAVSIQTAMIVLWFFFRRRGVLTTLAGSIFLGLCISAAHYLAIASADDLQRTLLAVPQYRGAVSGHYLAWAATIMTYLMCSICLCVFVVQQFRDELD
jgi:diguanylate cyclase